MIPIILEALGSLFGGATAAAETGAAVEGAAALGESKLAGNVPSVLQNMGNNRLNSFAETKSVNIRESANHTMGRISDMMTGDAANRGHAANDVEHIFGGRPDILGDMSKHNHVVDMLTRSKSANDNFNEPSNDNVKDVVIATLEPLLKSIDRNTYKIVEQIKELGSSLDKLFTKLDERELEAKDAAPVAGSAGAGGSNDDNSNRPEQPKPDDDKKQGVMSKILGALTSVPGLLIGGTGAAAVGTGIEYATGHHHEATKGGGYNPKDTADIVAGNFTGRERQFLKTVSENEGAGYDTVFGNGKFGKPDKKLTDMTIDEVIAYQKQLREKTKAAGYGKDLHGNVIGTSAVGKGQFVEGTLKNTLKSLGISEDQWSKIKYTPELQNKLILQNARRAGLDPNHPETLTQDKWGKQWESGAATKMSAARFKEQKDLIAAASTDREYIADGSDGHWGKGFNPLAKIKGQHSDSMLMTTKGGKHDADSIDISVPKGMNKDQYIKELKGMFPGAAVSPAQGNNVHIIFSGWGGASNIKALDTSSAKGPKNGVGPAVNNSSAKSSAKAASPNPVVVQQKAAPAPAPAINSNDNNRAGGTQKRREVPSARPTNSMIEYWS